jgi:hypothetical protein
VQGKLCLFAATICIAVWSCDSAYAITVEVAKKCDDLTARAYPLRVPGNPAAGHLNGSSQDIQAFYNKCVATDGNIGEPQAPSGGTQPHSQPKPQM